MNIHRGRGISRRSFLAGATGIAAATTLGVSGFGGSAFALAAEQSARRRPLPRPGDAPFDTVVVLMMENRSFDTMLGWLKGANGKQAGLSYVDTNGESHATFPLAPEYQGCDLQDPAHFWPAMTTHYADGACDGFLKTQPVGDLFPIGYYTAEDLPILAALARNYTTFDNYFCSMGGPTWPNRLYQLSGTTDLNYTGVFPAPDQERPVKIETTVFDRLKAAGKTGGYYYFGEPMTGLFASKKYDTISYDISKFFEDAKDGKLPNVTFVDPDYTSHAELNGTSNDYHPYGSVQVAEEFVAKVHDALKNSPQWDRMVFVLNFDENGGFYDHVPPPRVPDDTVIVGGGEQPDFTRLGFRVPAIALGPFAPKRIEKRGPFEHCSVLRMIEWRFGLEPMALRDKKAKNLASALDFTKRRDPIDLPAFTAAAPEICA